MHILVMVMKEVLYIKLIYHGFEWWTGKEWSSDKEVFKDLCKNDSTIRSLNDLINS